jgi:cytochrome c-type protein NapB
MKTINKITIGLVATTLLIVGCGDVAKAAPAKEVKAPSFVTEESLGLRKTDLYSEASDTKGHKAQYSKTYAGSGHKIKRAFQDAPPMIPHDVEGMLPVTIKDNQCISCHDPKVAKDMGATPYPSSHMTNFRPSSSYAIKGENTSDGTLNHISIVKDTKLIGARFNCTQCHAPQSGDDLAVENTFEAVYTHKDGASKSSWSGTKLMEGIDTTK